MLDKVKSDALLLLFFINDGDLFCFVLLVLPIYPLTQALVSLLPLTARASNFGATILICSLDMEELINAKLASLNISFSI